MKPDRDPHGERHASHPATGRGDQQCNGRHLATGLRDVPLIPVSRGPRGPIVAAQRRKRLGAVAGLWLIGLLPCLLSLPLPWRALGIGLVLPGAGFLYRGNIWLFLLSIALLPFVFYRMWIAADHLSLPALYATTAIGSAAIPGRTYWPWVSWAVPVATIGIGVIVEALRWRGDARARRLGKNRNDYLAHQHARTDIRSIVSSSAELPRVVESSESELQLQRWVLDHALQPMDDWSAYDWSEKAQRDTRSVRYQLNWLQWALAVSQYTRTPSFSGYLAEGQRRLIDRMLDRRVWGYWRAENIGGNLSFSADPVRKDNVMYSGYLALMVGTYALLNSDRCYDRPGALTFRWNDRREFAYDHSNLVDIIHRNFENSRFGLFACEPAFVFPICNIFALLAIAFRDRLDGTHRERRLLSRFADSLDREFTAADGDLHLAVSDRYGVRLLVHRGAELTGQHGFYLRPLLPGLSDRMWLTCRRELVEQGVYRMSNAKGRSMMLGDWGSKSASTATLFTSLASQAREYGDEVAYADVIEHAREALDWRVSDGVGCYEAVSRVANAQLALAQLNRHDGGWSCCDRLAPRRGTTGRA